MLCQQPSFKNDVFPVNPAQQWLLSYFPSPFAWFDRIEWKLKGQVSLSAIDSVVQQLVERHDSLRTIFFKGRSGWQQQVLRNWPSAAIASKIYFVEELTEEKYLDFRDNLALDEAEAFEISEGPLFRVLLFKRSDIRYDVFFLFHHIIVDYIACVTLHKEFLYLHSRYCSGKKVELSPAKSNVQYMNALSESIKANSSRKMRDFWKNEEHYSSCLLKLGGKPGPVGESKRIKFTLPTDESMVLLRRGKIVLGTESMHPILVAPLYRIMQKWLKQDRVAVSHKLHGRSLKSGDYAHFSTVGNFAVNVPVVCKVTSVQNWRELICHIDERLQILPMKGLSYDLVHAGKGFSTCSDHRLAPIRFNYMGISQYQDLVKRVEHPEQILSSSMEFFMYFYQKSLHIEFLFDGQNFDQADAKDIFDCYITHLCELISVISEE